jgi:hypothetical protein
MRCEEAWHMGGEKVEAVFHSHLGVFGPESAEMP